MKSIRCAQVVLLAPAAQRLRSGAVLFSVPLGCLGRLHEAIGVGLPSKRL